MKRFHLTVFIFCLVACSENKNLTDKIQLIISSIDTVNIERFKNLLIETRGKKEGSHEAFIRSYVYYVPGGQDIILIPHNSKTTLSYLIKSESFQKIENFAALKGVQKEKAIEFYIQFSRDVASLFNRLKIQELYNNPGLGNFTVFRIDEEHDLIYLPDSAEIKSEYWKSFF